MSAREERVAGKRKKAFRIRQRGPGPGHGSAGQDRSSTFLVVAAGKRASTSVEKIKKEEVKVKAEGTGCPRRNGRALSRKKPATCP